MQPDENPDITSHVTRLIRGKEILVDHRPLAIVPDAHDVETVLRPLVSRVLRLTPTGARGIVGIAGPPASGKSALLGWLAATAQAMCLPGIAFLSLDGYHLPNAELERRTGIDQDGRTVPLRQLKGTPDTFDAKALLTDLRQLQSSARAMRLPAYSRELHEPVPQAVSVGAEVKWVFVEGNFLFLDEPVWRDICVLFDYRIFVDASDDLLRHGLAVRHGRAGRKADWIAAHFAAVDGPNIMRVRASSADADVILCRNDGGS